jgi:hypothetical protein
MQPKCDVVLKAVIFTAACENEALALAQLYDALGGRCEYAWRRLGHAIA